MKSNLSTHNPSITTQIRRLPSLRAMYKKAIKFMHGTACANICFFLQNFEFCLLQNRVCKTVQHHNPLALNRVNSGIDYIWKIADEVHAGEIKSGDTHFYLRRCISNEFSCAWIIFALNCTLLSSHVLHRRSIPSHRLDVVERKTKQSAAKLTQ